MKKLPVEVMLNAHASYCDLIGQAQLAWHIDENTALETIVKMCNIDTSSYEAVGIALNFSRNGFGLSLYLAKKEPLPNGKLQTTSVTVELKRREFFALVKDLEVKLFDPYVNHNELYEYTGEENLDNVTINRV